MLTRKKSTCRCFFNLINILSVPQINYINKQYAILYLVDDAVICLTDTVAVPTL
jgi:hypothetical protein